MYKKQFLKTEKNSYFSELAILITKTEQIDKVVRPDFVDEIIYKFDSDIIRYKLHHQDEKSEKVVEVMAVKKQLPSNEFKVGTGILSQSKRIHLHSFLFEEREDYDFDGKLLKNKFNNSSEYASLFESLSAHKIGENENEIYVELNREVLEISFVFAFNNMRNSLKESLENIQTSFCKDKETLENLFGTIDL